MYIELNSSLVQFEKHNNSQKFLLIERMSTISEEQELDTNNELLVNDSEQLNEIWSNSVKNKKMNVFECDVCKRVFTRQLSLNEHKYIHTNCKPFQCLKCGKTFRQSKK